MYGAVYKISNLINGKAYIGQSIDPAHRRTLHFSGGDYQSSPVLRKAMRKYGKESFEFTILEWVKSKEDLDCKEVYWIKELNTLLPNGYNIREGGSRSKMSEASKRKISKANKGRLVGEKNPCFGRTGPKNPMYGKVGPNKGKVLSEEQKCLISERIMGKKRSKETKSRLRTSALARWVRVREDHLLEKGHDYSMVRLASGAIRCRICKNEADRRWRARKRSEKGT